MNNHPSIAERLARTADAMRHPEVLHESLGSFFPNARKIIVSINLCSSVGLARESGIGIHLVHIQGLDAQREIQVVTHHQTDGRLPGTILAARLLREYPELSIHAQPVVDHYYTEGSYLGTLMIPGTVSSDSVETISTILVENKGIFITLFLDCVQYAQKQDPYPKIFCDMITSVARAFSLTRREHEVLVYHIFGDSYDRIGELLNISRNTVRTHVNAIHRKTQTRNVGELHTMYFTPMRRISNIRQ